MRWLRDAAYLSAVTATAPVWAWRMHRTGKHRTDWRARFPQDGEVVNLMMGKSMNELVRSLDELESSLRAWVANNR